MEDTWDDADRTDPASPVYADNTGGNTPSDTDGDLELESAWFSAGTAATLGATAGHLNATPGTSSSSWTTYFTPEAGPIDLANSGDKMRITWVFTPTGVNATNTSQAFPFAVVNSPGASRVAADGSSPASAAYTGYAIYANMGATLGNSNPFALRERINPSGNFLSTSGEWGANGVAGTLANGATSGNSGYTSGTQYTMLWEMTRSGANLDIAVSMSGGTLDNDGVASVAYTDTSPNSFQYDTFGWRPALATTTATFFDTTLFKVEFIPVPEPTTLVLLGLALPALALARRRKA